MYMLCSLTAMSLLLRWPFGGQSISRTLRDYIHDISQSEVFHEMHTNTNRNLFVLVISRGFYIRFCYIFLYFLDILLCLFLFGFLFHWAQLNHIRITMRINYDRNVWHYSQVACRVNKLDALKLRLLILDSIAIVDILLRAFVNLSVDFGIQCNEMGCWQVPLAWGGFIV